MPEVENCNFNRFFKNFDRTYFPCKLWDINIFFESTSFLQYNLLKEKIFNAHYLNEQITTVAVVFFYNKVNKFPFKSTKHVLHPHLKNSLSLSISRLILDSSASKPTSFPSLSKWFPTLSPSVSPPYFSIFSYFCSSKLILLASRIQKAPTTQSIETRWTERFSPILFYFLTLT